jgi:competence transcription factor ComK
MELNSDVMHSDLLALSAQFCVWHKKKYVEEYTEVLVCKIYVIFLNGRSTSIIKHMHNKVDEMFYAYLFLKSSGFILQSAGL